jgi:hypothetical protein
MSLWNVRISGQIEAASQGDALTQLAAFLNLAAVDPNAGTESPLLEGALVRCLPDASDPVAVAEFEQEIAEREAKAMREAADARVKAAVEAVTKAREKVAAQ